MSSCHKLTVLGWPFQSESEDAVPIRWQCPVAVSTRVYTAKSDIYSFGVLVWEIYSGGARPFSELASSEIINAVRAGHRLALPSASSAMEVVGLIRSCTHMDVSARPSIGTVLQVLVELCARYTRDTRAKPLSAGLSNNLTVVSGERRGSISLYTSSDQSTGETPDEESVL